MKTSTGPDRKVLKPRKVERKRTIPMHTMKKLQYAAQIAQARAKTLTAQGGLDKHDLLRVKTKEIARRILFRTLGAHLGLIPPFASLWTWCNTGTQFKFKTSWIYISEMTGPIYGVASRGRFQRHPLRNSRPQNRFRRAPRFRFLGFLCHTE